MKIAHVVNPLVVADPRSDLNYAQPVTLETMKRARDQCTHADVMQYAACFEEDLGVVPDDMVVTPVLERSILDEVEAPNGRVGRKLPLLKDILDRAYEAASDADYLVYSNIDIGLWPNFYDEIARIVEDGTDAFLFGRRTLSTEHVTVDALDKIWAQEGTPHWGLSCFVFPRSHYPSYDLRETCIGLQPVGVTLAINMMQHAQRFQNFSTARLTFHLGDDRVWQSSLLDAYHVHNERMLDRVLSGLRRDGSNVEIENLIAAYDRWRSDYVIGACRQTVLRHGYRLVRKLGFGSWVARQYDRR